MGGVGGVVIHAIDCNWSMQWVDSMGLGMIAWPHSLLGGALWMNVAGIAG